MKEYRNNKNMANKKNLETKARTPGPLPKILDEKKVEKLVKKGHAEFIPFGNSKKHYLKYDGTIYTRKKNYQDLSVTYERLCL